MMAVSLFPKTGAEIVKAPETIKPPRPSQEKTGKNIRSKSKVRVIDKAFSV
jgi:hypothetical protein